MKKVILYIHGKGGSHLEAEQYKENCSGFDSVGVRRATRLSPCDFKGFQRHLQSAYVLVRLIHLP